MADKSDKVTEPGAPKPLASGPPVPADVEHHVSVKPATGSELRTTYYRGRENAQKGSLNKNRLHLKIKGTARRYKTSPARLKDYRRELLSLGLPGDIALDIFKAVDDFSSKPTNPYIDEKIAEHLPRLLAQVVAAAFNAAKNKSPSGMGDKITGLGRYSDHKDEFPDPLDFLKAVYAGRLGPEGDLDQSKLRKLDGPLMDALNLAFRGEARRAELRAFLPTKSDRLDQQLQNELGYIPQGEERKRALTSLSRGHRVGVRTLKPT